MALFSRKNKTEGTEEAKQVSKTKESAGKKANQEMSVKQSLPTDRNLSSVIKRPRITEKSVTQSEKNVYTFEVHQDASKTDVAKAIKAFYEVTPVRVNIVNKRPRKFSSRIRGRVIAQPGIKKAYVYLKPGDSINLI